MLSRFHTNRCRSATAARIGATLMAGLVLAACASARPSAPVSPRPLGRDIPVYVPPARETSRPVREAFTPPTDSVSLSEAVALALLHSPALASFAWETRAREARVVQAGRLPNPVLGALMEDIGASSPGGTAATPQTVQPQTTLQLSQLIELGGKRTARREFAARTRDLAAWDYEAARIQVLTRVTHDFIDVLAAQEMVTLNARTSQLVTQMQQSVAARVEAGVVSPIEETRANVALALVQVESNRAVRGLEATRRRLATNWGLSNAVFPGGTGNLEVVSALPPMTALMTRLSENPDIARWATEILQREAAVSAARATRIPDVTFTAGYRRLSDIQATAFLFGASFPLPLFDNNGGTVREARSMLAKAYEEARAAEAQVSGRLTEAYRTLAVAHDEVGTLRTTVLPGSRETFEAVTEGYRAGKFGFLDVLDAQRTLIAAEGQYLRALADYHKAVADVERLIGAPLTDAGNMSTRLQPVARQTNESSFSPVNPGPGAQTDKRRSSW